MSEHQSPADRQWRVDRAGAWLRDGGSVLFLGNMTPAESTAMLTSIAAQSAAYRIMRCGVDAGHADRPYHALADLLATTTDRDLASLPEPQRAILSGAPFRPAPQADHFTPAGVRLAVLNLCRRLARTGRLLLILDQLHHLDLATSDVLRFVARAGAGLPMQLLATEQLTSSTRSTGHRVCPRPLLVLGLGSLTPADMSHLIDALTLTNPPDARP